MSASITPIYGLMKCQKDPNCLSAVGGVHSSAERTSGMQDNTFSDFCDGVVIVRCIID